VRALVAVGHGVAHVLALFERAEATTVDLGVVHEHVDAATGTMKPKPLPPLNHFTVPSVMFLSPPEPVATLTSNTLGPA
jgi:hypothetical protein